MAPNTPITPNEQPNQAASKYHNNTRVVENMYDFSKHLERERTSTFLSFIDVKSQEMLRLTCRDMKRLVDGDVLSKLSTLSVQTKVGENNHLSPIQQILVFQNDPTISSIPGMDQRGNHHHRYALHNRYRDMGEHTNGFETYLPSSQHIKPEHKPYVELKWKMHDYKLAAFF